MTKPYLIKDFKECQQLVEVPAVDASSKAYLTDLIHPNEGLNISYSMVHFFLEPGSRSIKLKLIKSSDLLYILEGHATVFIDDEVVKLVPQQILFIPPGAMRFIRNEGSTPLKFLSIANPPFQLDEVEVLEAATINPCYPS